MGEPGQYQFKVKVDDRESESQDFLFLDGKLKKCVFLMNRRKNSILYTDYTFILFTEFSYIIC